MKRIVRVDADNACRQDSDSRQSRGTNIKATAIAIKANEGMINR